MKKEIKYFKDLTGFDIIKTKYKELVKKYHPDLNIDNLGTMQAINAEYDYIIENLARFNTNSINLGNESEFKEIILELIKLNLEIEICGSWLWIDGDTKTHKEKLKELKCLWAPVKKKWYFRPAGKKTFSKGKFSMNEIRAKYGSACVKSDRKKITA